MNFLQKKSFASVKESGNTSSLKKTLGAVDLILFGLGAIIGTGVFVFTGYIAAEYSGPAVIVSYMIAGGTCIFVALAYTELAAMLPTSGSIYTYTYVAFGEIFAWLVGGLIIIEFGFATATISAGWSAYVQGIFDAAGMPIPHSISHVPSEGGILNLPALLIMLFVGGMLYMGTKDSKRLNTILVIIKMVAIFAFIFSAAPHFDATNWDNFMPYGFNKVLYGASILFFAFTGFGVLASAAEECKNPKRDLTIGIIGSIILSTVIYVIVAALATGIIPYTQLNNAQPLAYALTVNNSHIGSAIVATGAIAGMTTVMMMNLYGQSRIFYVIARDGLLPECMAKLHHKYESPHITLIIFTLMAALLGAFCPFKILGQLSSMGALIDYIIVALIVMVFRVKLPNVERPFKCPIIFIIAPVALTAAAYLLFQQILNEEGELLLSGRLIIYWFTGILSLYILRSVLFKTNNVDNN